MSIVLYSALFGDCEPMNPEVFGGFRGDRAVIVSDRPRPVPEGVELMLDPSGGLDPARASRRAKLMPHRYFPEAEWSIWLDNKSRLLVPPETIVAALRAEADAGFYAFPHFRRDCVYQEGQTVRENGLDDHRIILERMRTYRAEGMPERFGLIEGHFIVRRHMAADVVAFGEEWFDHVRRYSRRDQISFPYLAWKRGFNYRPITSLAWKETVRFTVFDRKTREPEFPRHNLLYQRLRRVWHGIRGRRRAP
ncbi:MAG: glycosyltransferase domain-containing protein [Paracoccaceae bacterium]